MKKSKCILLLVFILFSTIPGQADQAYPPIVPEGETIPGIEELIPGELADGRVTVSRQLAYLIFFQDSVAFSPDGRTLASGFWDATVKLWDSATGREIMTLSGHTSSVSSVAFSPDGRTLASGSLDDTVKLWDLSTYKQKYTLIFGQNGNWLAWDAREKKVYRYDDGTFLCRMEVVKRIPVEPENTQPGVLEVVSSPESLSVTNGEITDLPITVKNPGDTPVYWTYVVLDELNSGDSPFILHPSGRAGVIHPGKEYTFSCGISAYCSYDSPEESKPLLRLRIEGLNFESIPVTIPTTINVPMLSLTALQLRKEGGQNLLSARIRNKGSVPLPESTISLKTTDSDTQFTTITQPKIGPGKTVSVPFSVPEGLKLTNKSRITLRVEKTAYPVHVWLFEDQKIEIINVYYYLFYSFIYIFLIILVISLIYTSKLFYDLLKISIKPEAVCAIPLDRLIMYQRVLNIRQWFFDKFATGKQLNPVFTIKDFRNAVSFYKNPIPEKWHTQIAELLSVTLYKTIDN